MKENRSSVTMFDATPMDTEDEQRQLSDALKTLHDAAWRWTLTCCRGDHELALEALQESYLAVLDGKARFKGQSSFKTFVFGVIRLTCKRVRRKQFGRSWFFEPIERAENLPTAPRQEANVRTRQTDAALACLSERQRAMAELVLLNDMTVTDAADVLGISAGSAGQHYARAKTRLRAELKIEEGSRE